MGQAPSDAGGPDEPPHQRAKVTPKGGGRGPMTVRVFDHEQDVEAGFHAGIAAVM
jgi:hypothetical protein